MKNNPLHTLYQFYNRMIGIKRVKTPTLLQMEAVECGAASLGIILAHFGKYIPLEQLRVDCGVSRNGSTAGNILKAARNYGLEVKAFKKDPDQLKSSTFPVIVFWNFYHFLVVEGFGKRKFFLNDPTSGPRTVDEKTFDTSFTGVVLTFSPGPNFKQGGSKSTFVPFLFNWLKGHKKNLAFLFLVGLALIVPGLTIPLFSKIFVDQILVSQNDFWIIPLLTGIALTALLRTLLTYILQNSLIRFELNMSLKNSSKFLWHLLKLPMAFHTQRTSGDLTVRVNINDQISSLISGQLGQTFLSLLMIVFYAAMMLYYSLPLAMAAISISMVNLLALKYISRKRVDSNQKLLQEQGRLFGLSSSGLQMIESLKATASESEFFSRWTGAQARLLNIEQKLGRLTQSLLVIPVILTSLSTIIILWIGSGYIMDGVMTAGTFVAFQSLMASFNQPVVSLVNLGSALQDLSGGMKRLDDVYKYPSDNQDNSSVKNQPLDKNAKLQGYIDLKNITFGYSPLEPPLISGFSLSLKPGSRVAIVGRTGSGKSTIANLVSGLYEPWNGDILFDGKPRKKISETTLHNSIGMVDQNLFLFEGTVKDNITFWDKTISGKEVIEAAMDASIHEDISSRPDGYESLVTENGMNFSGGQRQRLEIARALAGKPSILILDEATSALDAKTEYQIDLNIRKKGCTCLIISHRLSTIRDCDEIIVLEKGKIVQRGTHLDLIGETGLYRQMIKEL